MARRPVAVYWGRFNPPHKGHLQVIRRFRRRYRLIVVVGSAERSNTRRDPFSGRERKSMLEAYLRERRIRGARVVTLNDGPSVTWALETLVRRHHPDVLLLSDEKSSLATRAAQRVRVVRFARRGTVSSTRIRRAIARGDPSWSVLTGRSVVRLIERYHGIRRIRRAYGVPEPASPARRGRRGRGRKLREEPSSLCGS
ncbi:MAG TPA: adenylyltransferase/cytidyltransferase family protein [Thermoplasmata archaeon]|jgi:cytidyltransferase-like protein|nr:adenylyltransferase/cytidyltransferase family protein [Thermoplasmata archaeon]